MELGSSDIFGDIFGSVADSDGGKTTILEPGRKSIDNELRIGGNELRIGFEHSIASQVENEILRRRKQ